MRAMGTMRGTIVLKVELPRRFAMTDASIEATVTLRADAAMPLSGVTVRLIEDRNRTVRALSVFKGVTEFNDAYDHEVARVSPPELSGDLRPNELRAATVILPTAGAAPSSGGGPGVHIYHKVVAEGWLDGRVVTSDKRRLVIVPGSAYGVAATGGPEHSVAPPALAFGLTSRIVELHHSLEGRAELRAGGMPVSGGTIDVWLQRTETVMVHDISSRHYGKEWRSHLSTADDVTRAKVKRKTLEQVKLASPALAADEVADLPFSLSVPRIGQTTSTEEGSVAWRLAGSWRAGSARIDGARDIVVSLPIPGGRDRVG